MEISSSMIANIAMNFLGQAAQSGALEDIFGGAENNQNVQEENNQAKKDAGLFEKEYEAEQLYGTVGQIAGYAAGGVAGGVIGKLLGTFAGGIIEDVKEEVLGEDSPYLQFEQKINNVLGGILSFITGDMSVEEEAGGSMFSNEFKTLMA
ncbi:TPA: hypothetical protein IAA92_01025 [Candidatus Galligastranaerophilus intestinigallinarum]|nr:hypothetical protein [Candidatus Galligastranaerophilus intestinigallinarum]